MAGARRRHAQPANIHPSYCTKSYYRRQVKPPQSHYFLSITSMMNFAAASAGRARAAEQSAQESAGDARNLATAFLGISSMAGSLNSWLAKEIAAADGQGMFMCLAPLPAFVQAFAVVAKSWDFCWSPHMTYNGLRYC